jgi:integrase
MRKLARDVRYRLRPGPGTAFAPGFEDPAADSPTVTRAALLLGDDPRDPDQELARIIAALRDLDARLSEHGRQPAQLLERDFAGPAYIDADLVFCDELGGAISPKRLTQWFREHRKGAGIPTGTLHVLRHTAATLALTSGVPVHIVAARLGDDPKTVLGTYAHLLPQSDEIAAERVAAALEA